ncbi:hypothetical protein KI688_005734 [Linnemannia hyalina]|uniref:Galactose oxidase n=1 Tax=Linnemannia hyalina TaxID=64524 RepID=A0A9P7Y2H4_9FUNG|nr:hypothetical protein KI688_005734 [Linnemannia hyalina]
MKFAMQLSTVVHCCLLWSVVTAAGPQPAYFSAYATVDESTFYIQGGSNISNSRIIYDQFYSLDLTQSWNVTNPPWSALAVGLVPARLKTVFHSISLSSNRKTLTFWDMYSLSPYSANYHLDTNAWELTSVLTKPSYIRYYILFSAHNGTKMILFGGTYNSSVYIDTLFILDVTTLTWSQGGKHKPRSGAACSVSGDYLLVWGGTSVDNAGIPATPDVYNINTAQWTNTFIAKIKPTPKPTTTTTTTTLPTGTGSAGVENPTTGVEPPSESNKAAIIGGSVGGGLFLLLLIVGGLCFWRRRRNTAQQHRTKEIGEEKPPAKKFQVRIVQQPETGSAEESTFSPSRPFRITPSNSHRKSNKKEGQEADDELSYYFHSHGGAPSPTRSEESFSSSAPSTATSTLEDDSHHTNVTNTTLLPQHIITLKPSQRQRYR